MGRVLKLSLPSVEAYEALLARCKSKDARISVQHTAFYDTENEIFSAARYQVELTSEEACTETGKANLPSFVTLTGPKRLPTGQPMAMHSDTRDTVTMAVRSEMADAVRHCGGQFSPLDLLPVSSLSSAMKLLANGAPIIPNGAAYESTRTTVPFALRPSTMEALDVILTIDATRYMWAGESMEQWQVECECSSQPGQSLQRGLQRLLDEIGCKDCPPAMSKRRCHRHFRRAVQSRRRRLADVDLAPLRPIPVRPRPLLGSPVVMAPSRVSMSPPSSEVSVDATEVPSPCRLEARASVQSFEALRADWFITALLGVALAIAVCAAISRASQNDE